MSRSSRLRRLTNTIALTGLVFLQHPATWAGVIPQATRVVFQAERQEGALRVLNNSEEEALIQSWIEPPEGQNDTPFVLVPPLARIPANSTQMLRVLYEGQGLPEDRESVAWINIQDIPAAADGDNVLQLAVRHAIKVFYRPPGLPGDPLEAAGLLRWQLTRDGDAVTVQVNNPTAYHVSMVAIELTGGPAPLPVAENHMAEPYSEHRFTVPAALLKGQKTLDFVSINDFGAGSAYRGQVVEGQPIMGQPFKLVDR